MQSIELSAGAWSVRALRALTFGDRLAGNRRIPPGSSLIMKTRSVHGFGQDEPIAVVGLDRHMKVVATRTLRPNRVIILPTARYILELPAGSPLPDLDDQVETRLV